MSDRQLPEAPSDGFDRRAFIRRSAALSAAAATGAGLLADATPARAAVVPFVGADVRQAALDDVTEATIAELATLIRRRQVSVLEAVQAHVDRVRAVDPVLQAFNATPLDAALQRARALTRRRPTGALFGVPLCIKDNCYTAGVPTTANSLIYADFTPTYDATVVARLLANDAVLLGKGQMGPLATTRATRPNGTVTTVNAWTPGVPAYDPGGSSTGPATAVASREAVSSIGTQTGGSITGPSRQQGLTGLKPTMGRTSLYGVIPLTYTRDHVGPLARDAVDAAIMLTAMAGADAQDPRTQGLPRPANYQRAARPVRFGGRVYPRYRTTLGVLPDFLAGGTATSVSLRQRFLADMAKLDVRVVDVPFPEDWADLVGTEFNNVRLPERSEPFMDVLRTDVRQFGVSLTSWVNGLFLTGDTYLKGQRMKDRLLKRTLEGIFSRCDVVTQASNQPFDIIGLPEITFPVGFSTEQPDAAGAEVPYGVILGAAPYAEDRLLALAGAYQGITDWHTRRPPEPAAVRALRSRDVPQLSPEEVAAQSQ